jgi:hypothetical protein
MLILLENRLDGSYFFFECSQLGISVHAIPLCFSVCLLTLPLIPSHSLPLVFNHTGIIALYQIGSPYESAAAYLSASLVNGFIIVVMFRAHALAAFFPS